MPTVPRVIDITKYFGEIRALDSVSLELEPGSIHGLVGENGAGKTTLARVIAGLETPDSGVLSQMDGVALVPQHPRPAPGLPLWENLIVGEEIRMGPFLSRKKSRRWLKQWASRLEIDINLDQETSGMNAGETRLAALLAALSRTPRILVLDEPSVGLDAHDRESVRKTIRRAAREGTAVLLVSHDLNEIRDLADSVTVLRDARNVAEFRAPFVPEEIARAMFPELDREPSAAAPHPSAPRHRFQIDELCGIAVGSGRKVGPVNLSVAAGEVVAVLGLREAGIELMERLFSGELWITGGSVSIDGTRLPSRISPKRLRNSGISYIPSDRIHRGATLDGSVEENLILHQRREFHRGGFIQSRNSAAFSDRLLSRFNVDTSRLNRLASLSGGNIQRVILSRELSLAPDVLIIAEPGAGLDIAGQAQLHGELSTLSTRGSSIIILTSDLREAITFGSRISVMYGGTVRGTFTPDQPGRITQAMAGIEPR